MAYAIKPRARWLTPVLAVVVAAFLLFSLPPYFTGGTRVPATFGWHYPLLVAHVMFGSVAMVSAVAQIWPRLRARHPVLHRRVGRVYVSVAIPAAAFAMVIGAATPFGPFLAVSNVLLGAVWLWFTINGFAATRQRRFADHRRHMVRSATVALSTITNRIWTPLLFITLQPLQDSVFDGSEEHYLWFVAGLGAWLGWTIPLATVQWWLIRRPLARPHPQFLSLNSYRRGNLHAVVEQRRSANRDRAAMATEFNGKIELDIRDSEPDWGPYAAPTAPEGAPNVLYLVWDDTGIATWDCFGGLVEMPTMSRIAERGVRLSQFHTTALCSPTRASLLTGRNPTTVGMATIEEFTDGFPGCNGRIPDDTALLSEVLAEQGYNTYCVGKWHLTPLEESNLAATRRHWPLARGFERFYGFMGGETDQWYPELVYDNHPVAPPGLPEDGYHLSKDIADKTIEFIRDAKVIAPDKPWFSYVCPGAGHAPHHVFKDWADRYAGKFDMGYERYREIVLENQKRLGIVPPDTELSPINPYADVKGPNGEPWPPQDTVRPWDSLADDEKRLFARMAEVFAGFLSYTDAQIGRVLDYLEESGQLDNTVIVVISDNGASGEGGPNGSVNEVKFFNGYIDTVEDGLRVMDNLGGPETYNHYPIGWAMAFNTPYKLFKRYASHEGGIADTAIISWPDGIAAHGEVRDNYTNVCDITPTVYELLGITPPATVKGIAQKPLDGVSFKAALHDPEASTGKETQFYAMLGTRGIWHDGWFANTVHAASPAGWSNFDKDRWELFRIEADRSQCHDVAAENAERLEELKALWFREADKYNGMPLSDLNILETMSRFRPYLTGARESYFYYPGTADVGMGAAVEIGGRSFVVMAEVTVDTTGAEGVVFKHGGGHGGHVLFIQDGRLHYIYNFLGEEEQVLSSPGPVPVGTHTFGVAYTRTGAVEGSHTPTGDAALYIDDTEVASRSGVRIHPGTFGLAGATLSVGRNTGSPVSRAYKAPFAFTGGTIAQVNVDVSGQPYVDLEREFARAFARD